MDNHQTESNESVSHQIQQLMFETSPQTGVLDASMAKAQGEIQTAVKDKDNPFFKSKYADLAAVWFACRDALSKNGVSVTQWPIHTKDDRLHIITRLACDGQWIKAEFSVPIGKQDAQGLVSATTYARRAALSAAVGVAPDDDDDGNGTAQNSKPTPKQLAQKDAKALTDTIAKFTCPDKLEGWWNNPETKNRIDTIANYSDKAPGAILQAYGTKKIELKNEPEQ